MANQRRDSGKAAFWRQVLTRWRRSGQGVREFCADAGLSEPSFYAWRRELAARAQLQARQSAQQRSTKAPRFVSVRVVSPPNPAPAPIEVVLGNGRVIRLAAAFDAALLRQLLVVLEAPPC